MEVPGLEFLPMLLGAAWLAPLASFTIIVFLGPRLGKAGINAGLVATGAICASCVCSLLAFVIWVSHYPVVAGGHHATESHAAESHAQLAAPPANLAHSVESRPGSVFHTAAFLTQQAPAEVAGSESQGSEVADHAEQAPNTQHTDTDHADTDHADGGHATAGHAETGHAPASHGAGAGNDGPVYVSGDWYSLADFGRMKISIGYHIDALTICMFAMVTLIASCIHFYATGYMHDELHDVTDHEVTLSDGHHLHRKGRYYRFFQYLSLFCFSMLGLVIAGNIAMVFVFWELVGICSYFLIGFYIERHSASTAANKAFITNRVGDFGMIIGLMAIWASLGTFTFGDKKTPDGIEPGIFSLVRPAASQHALTVPDGMVQAANPQAVAAIYLDHAAQPDTVGAQSEVTARTPEWRASGYGYWLLVIAGIGIFCGCVGKSAQFPLHVWLPDAMEGPTPVSALVHSATMVAAGVYLVGRFFPVFTPEVLLIIAYIGGITLFLAATIAITATDIKRVLAYSTVSQLGYMMLALGLGGWLAGMLHLFTHAFFKSLLFMCSGSVIHACHTNEMTRMGGLRKKMPYTAYTMLVGCLAIAGAGIPFVIGTSGYYSKDSILAQALSFSQQPGNTPHGWLFYLAAGGAAMTAFYMFRLWFMTFAGQPRDHHVYDHAHESPKVMYMPLVVLSVFAIGVAWPVPWVNLSGLLEQARPAGTLAGVAAGSLWPSIVMPGEHASHEGMIHVQATLMASATALGGFLLALMFYGLKILDPQDVRQKFAGIYRLLVNKWWFDELYSVTLVRPVKFVSRRISEFDKNVIDGFIDSLAWCVRAVSHADDLLDRFFVDGVVNFLAHSTHSIGLSLRRLQTGSLRQYVLFIVVGTVCMFVLATFLLQFASAG